MKKEILLLMTLILGISLKSFAGTGNAKNEFIFILSIIGFLLFVIVLLYGVDYIRKNGKTIRYKAMSFIKKIITNIKIYHKKIKSKYIIFSYPSSIVSKELDNKSTTSIFL